MSELIRHSLLDNVLIQCMDGKVSFQAKTQQLSLNLETGSISIGFPLKRDSFDSELNLRSDYYIKLKTETEKVAEELFSLQNELNGKAHIQMVLNIKHAKMRFSDGSTSTYNQNVGRVAACYNGDVRFYDFGVAADYTKLSELAMHAYKSISAAYVTDAQNAIGLNSISKPIVFILKPPAAAYFMHEVLGHVIEQDNWLTQHIFLNPNKRVLPEGCEIIDDPQNSEFLSYGEFDDAGNRTRKTTVISDGFICEQISLMRSAEYTQRALNRMSSFSLYNRHEGRNFTEMLDDYKRCVVIEEVSNGGVNPYTGDFFITGYRQHFVDNTEKHQLVPCTYYGKIGDLCDKIVEIGGDYASFIGVCSKKQQNLFVNNGSPSIVLSSFDVLS